MAAYEYLCLACEHRFEERRPMMAPVLADPACPSCGGMRVRRRFSFVAAKPVPGPAASGHAAGGCACGGACVC